MSHHQISAGNVPRLARDQLGNPAQRAQQNRAYVRRLLRERQPGFARALAETVADLAGEMDDITANDSLDDCG